MLKDEKVFNEPYIEFIDANTCAVNKRYTKSSKHIRKLKLFVRELDRISTT